MNLSGHGITARLPRSWEGAIVRQAPLDLQRSAVHALADDDGGQRGDGSPDLRTGTVSSLPVVHLANFALPPQRGDFGSGAVEAMRGSDVFIALCEYGSENIDMALFDGALPRHLELSDFHPLALQRPLPGQAGFQEFFVAAGRAFCLYVVLGGTSAARTSLAAVNIILAGLQIGSRP